MSDTPFSDLQITEDCCFLCGTQVSPSTQEHVFPKWPRRVYLTDDGKAAFESWTAGRVDSDVIFKDRFGNAWGSHDQHRPMAAACKAAGIEPAIGMHTLRHTYASSLVQAGVSLAIVAEALGHADTRMVSKHYGHLAPSHVADAIRAHLPALGIEINRTVTRLRP